jgi:chromate transporter
MDKPSVLKLSSDPAVPPGMPVSLWRLLALFARVGASAFGGNVPLHLWHSFSKSGWLSETAFLEAFNWCQCLPGSTGANLAALLGWRFQGWKGATFCPIVLILPGASVLLCMAGVLNHAHLHVISKAALHAVTAATVGLLLATIGRLAPVVLCDRWQFLGAILACLGVSILKLPIWGVILPLAGLLWLTIGAERHR